MVTESDSTKDLSALISEITWNFGPRGLKGECCGDLSQPEYRTLCLASDQSRCSMQAIAQNLGVTKSGATRIVDRLERKGYAERKRSLEDGRVCCIELTPSGMMLIEDLRRENANRIDKIMSRIEPTMREVIGAAFKSFVNALQKED